MSGPPARLKREVNRLGRTFNNLGWLEGLTFGFLVWNWGWNPIWVLLAFLLIAIAMIGVIDFYSQETVKRWLSEEIEHWKWVNMKR